MMVIFGAGASYDSASALRPNQVSATWRPPLANQLFDLKRFGDLISQFRKCHPLITYLQEANVEEVLEKYQSESGKDPERLRQLAAVRYYLQTMLYTCMIGWQSETKGVTNYKTLMDLIRHERTPGDRVCLVTFNYDTLLEDAVSDIVGARKSSIIDYVSGDYQIIKPHGSIEWAHEVIGFRDVRNQNPMNVASEVIEKIPELEIGEEYEIIPNRAISQTFSEKAYLPALAIPVQNKPRYECPGLHLRTLEKELADVTKLLIIGWRAADESFLKLLAKGLSKAPRILVVSSARDKATSVIEKLRTA